MLSDQEKMALNAVLDNDFHVNIHAMSNYLNADEIYALLQKLDNDTGREEVDSALSDE